MRLPCFPHTCRRPLGGERTYTAQWTCVQCPVDARTPPSGRREVRGKLLVSCRIYDYNKPLLYPLKCSKPIEAIY